MQLVLLAFTASLLLLVVAGCTAEEADAAAAPVLIPPGAPAARCQLSIVGDFRAIATPLAIPLATRLATRLAAPLLRGNRENITLYNGTLREAKVSCSGGPVHIAVDELLLGRHKAGFVGVKLDDTCITPGCLLTICGDSRVSIVDSSIRGVAPVVSKVPQSISDVDNWAPDAFGNVHVALCIKDSAHVVLHNTSISHGKVSGVMASGRTRLLVNASKVANNTGGAFPAGMVFAGSATVAITHGSIIGSNTRVESPNGLRSTDSMMDSVHNAWQDIVGEWVPLQDVQPDSHDGRYWPAAGVGCFERARVTISGRSSVYNNICETVCASGGVSLGGPSSVTVTGCSRIDNNTNGGIMAANFATLAIQGASRVVNNTYGGVRASGKASVSISGGVVVANNTGPSGLGVWEHDAAVYGSGRARVVVIGPAYISEWNVLKDPYSKDLPQRMPMVALVDQVSLTLVGAIKFSATNNTLHVIRTAGQATLDIDSHVTYQGRPLSKCNDTVWLGRLPCGVGETRARADVCQCCAPYTYAFEVNASCAACPLNAMCPGGDVVWPVAGYWHSSNYSVQMHKCPLSTTSCGEQGVCRQGYSGNLCGACAAGYGLASPLRCRPCGSGRHQLLLFVMLFLVCVVIISYTVHATWQDNNAGDSALRPSDVIKVLVQFLQYLVILGSVSVPWPSFLTDCFTAASTVFTVASGHNSLDCLLKQRHHGVGVPVAYLRQLFYLLLAPAAVLVAVMLVVVLSRCAAYLWSDFACSGRDRMRRAPFSWQLLGRLRVAALVVAFYAYPTLVKAALTFFACLPIDNASHSPHAQYAIRNHTAGYWVMDIQQECFTGSHRQWAVGLGVPAVIVLCLGVPVALFLMLWCNTENTFNKAFQQHYGFLYRNYADSKVWWEAVWAVQTVLLTAVSVFHFSIKAYYSLLLMMLILVLSAALQLVARPYIHTRLHRMHMAATCCLCLSVWLALTLFTMEFDIMALRPVHTAAGSLIVAVNVVFVACCSYTILHLAHPTIVKGVLAAVAWFTECCRCGPKHARPGGAPSPQ